MNSAARAGTQPGSLYGPRHRLFHFLTEMRRRRVCRAITMYSVAIWLVCQIVDVISPALELPEWTLKLVIVFGLIGLPIIVIMSWLFELTPDGLVAEAPGETPRIRTRSSEPRHIADKLIDGSLILAALAIGVQLAVGALGSEPGATDAPSRKIAVLPFYASSGEEAVHLSEGLAIELQHALRQEFGITVIASENPAQLRGSMSLTGVVSTSGPATRVAVTLIDFDSGEVAWSAAFEQSRADSYRSSAQLARQIARTLATPGEGAEFARADNVAR